MGTQRGLGVRFFCFVLFRDKYIRSWKENTKKKRIKKINTKGHSGLLVEETAELDVLGIHCFSK